MRFAAKSPSGSGAATTPALPRSPAICFNTGPIRTARAAARNWVAFARSVTTCNELPSKGILKSCQPSAAGLAAVYGRGRGDLATQR